MCLYHTYFMSPAETTCSQMLFLVYLVVTFAVSDAKVCYKGLCDVIPKPASLDCKGGIIKNGGICGCYDVCAKVEGEMCQAQLTRGRIPLGSCDKGLKCMHEEDMITGAGHCVSITPDSPDRLARSTQTVCEQRRIHAMISMIVYRGQWFPKCDADGLYMPEQCDNTGMCFCVDVQTGVVDESSKIQGSAQCGNEAPPTETLCEQRRRASLLSMVVYRGQWFPKCDADGLYMPEQCDNTGMCFCVDISTGVVDESSKVLGSALCGPTVGITTNTPLIASN